ncbi:hypothetical protein [Pseudomonas oryzae]|uniref:Uncharacterized protein n=1 Tax=Pseudomonas oryzae TaxID=1392877 RepID=A0A1H1VM99_9PSED|nr:hypothetical protein [Pseudomonas oryzae]SDS86007.1 hypothetical protein SAMN05216221_2819 [Pseudomonas oryzae]
MHASLPRQPAGLTGLRTSVLLPLARVRYCAHQDSCGSGATSD